MAKAASPAAAGGPVQASCPNPTEVQGFMTCADVDKARQEGSVVYYSPDVETHMVAYLQAFNDLFPEIKVDKYLREQTGRLYTKLTSERQAGQYVADVLSLSDYAPALDFVSKNGYSSYISPESVQFRPEFRSNPPGMFTWYNIVIAGIAVNSSATPPDEAPKNWPDLLEPKWKGGINFKDSASGLQFVQWYMLRQLYGDQYWKDMAGQNPRGLASTVQQYERLVNREDKINGLAQYSTFLENKAKGAPLEFIAPPDGLPVTPLMIGVVDKAPHPEAAKLFVDFMLSKKGQETIIKQSFSHGPREDVAPPEGGKPITELKLLIPDWTEIVKSSDQFKTEWNNLTGLQ
ncbi:MAG TPA: extracellular solute-binding protein [Dehalococcoidia bacterium]|nr:extracellular solute-binding protein [Dehalococcoidia bacterium]